MLQWRQCGYMKSIKLGHLSLSRKVGEGLADVISTLQKTSCFNHRVVALVADKLERQWLLEVCFDVED